MLFDFIRAFPAAILVGVVPGWFWARCLCATADRAERLAYSAGFSIMLVPSAALLQARLFGTGVTLPIAAASVLLVLGTGLLAYLKWGPAKGSDNPLLTSPVSPGPHTLVPLAGASALMLGVLLGVAPREWAVPLIALLVLAGGAASLFYSRPRRLQETAGIPASAFSPAARWLLLSVVGVLALLRSYPGPLRYDWPFPRGVDKYEHAVMVDMMLSRGATESFMLYPPGMHVLAALVTRFSGLEPIKLFAVLSPALLLLPVLACYAVARRLWGWETGVAAALFCGLITSGSYQHVVHARYANLLGVFLLVLTVGALLRLYASASMRNLLTLAALGSSVVFYHQVASLYEALLLGLVGLLLVPYLLLREPRRGLALLGSLALLFPLSVLYAWDTYDLPRLVGGLLGGPETGRGGEAVAMALGTKPKFSFAHLLETVSHPGMWLGFFGGLLLLAPRGVRARPSEVMIRATLLAWALLMFAGSRTIWSNFPDRFERDLSLPIALLAAPALVVLLRSLAQRGLATRSAALLAVLLVVAGVGLQAARNLEEGAGPSVRSIDRPPPTEVVAAGEWLREHNKGGNILATPSVGPVSTRGMLAMGGYSGVQTYSVHRIERNRDLPPSGAGPLWDALWALHHPADRRTMRFMEENDIRYVVLEKGHPGVDRRLFERRKDLYREVFENEVAVIFETRGSLRRGETRR